MSNPPPAIIPAKAIHSPNQGSPAQTQTGSATGLDTFGQRRNGGSGSFGAGAATRASSAPRNNQAGKKSHKASKRFRLADEDAMAESAAVRSLNSRKGQTSITHLMNFSLPPRPQNHYNHSYGHARHARRNPTWGLGSGYHAADKARYVHANYRFVVDPRGEYHAQSIDADLHLDWGNVLQILASARSQEASCPICLGTPVAPRMAKCGHIFCLPCLIRFMSNFDSETTVGQRRARSKPCPLCEDSIYTSETRPVRWYVGQENEAPREGGDVVLRLVFRPAGSTLALPRDGADALGKGEDIPWHNAAEVMDYSRVTKGSELYMLEQLDHDIAEIERQEKEDEVMFGEDNIEWSRRAIQSIQDAKERCKGIGNPPSMPAKPTEQKPRKAPIQFNAPGADTPEMYSVRQAAASGQSLSDVTTASHSEISTDATSVDGASPMNTISAPPKAADNARALSMSLAQLRQQQHEQHAPSEYHFYQALLHYYLSPLDIRILKAAFGTYSAFPSTILPRVEHVSTGHVVDDEFRRRTKYLGHLPYGCEVAFLECDWTDTVPAEVLEKFKPDIERRRKKNEDKDAREEKARLKAEKDEEKQYAFARRRRQSITENKFTEGNFQPLSEAGNTPGSFDPGMSTSPPWGARQGSSFASLASPSTSPSAPRTIWGTPALPASATSPQMVALRPEQDVEDGWLQDWEKDLLKEDDEMIAQTQAMSLVESSSSKSPAGGGKKKKGKKMTLMSTQIRRGA